MSYEHLQRALSSKSAVLRDYGFWRIMVDEAQNVSVSVVRGEHQI